MQKTKHQLRETDIPSYLMATLSLDLSGPHPTTLSGNKYIIAFVEVLVQWLA